MKITEGRVRLAASDVADFLACRRLTQLDLLRARGELRPPRQFDIGFQDLVLRGEVHERAEPSGHGQGREERVVPGTVVPGRQPEGGGIRAGLVSVTSRQRP